MDLSNPHYRSHPYSAMPQAGEGGAGVVEASGSATMVPALICSALVGESHAISSIRHLIEEVAATRASVLIYGESGTGKELIARLIHASSKQSGGPFVAVNMAGIPHSRGDELLFGAAAGAGGGGQVGQLGYCEAADGGTIFFDEVADIEPSLQPKLLRFVQEGIVQRVGAVESRQIAARIITATYCDPAQVVSQGRMREDLFFRLHVAPIYVPPLRERPEDIRPLAQLFLRRSAERHERAVEGFSEEALRVLEQHDWPGNARQLENMVERLVVFCHEPIVPADLIPADDHLASAYAERRRLLAGSNGNGWRSKSIEQPRQLTPMERHERAAIVDALRRVDGHVVGAARLLGLGQATVYRKIKMYGITNGKKRRSSET